MREASKRALWFAAASLLGGGCDLASKDWAARTLTELPRQSMRVVPPWLELSLSYNRGTAFSLVSDLGDARVVLGVLSLLVVIGLLVMAVRKPSLRLDALALGTIAGGAIGNGWDRAFRDAPGGGTGVVDFISVHYPGGVWPTFNVADALVAVGVGLLLLARWRASRRGAEPPEALEPEPG